ncbi:MAG: type II secretion system protein [Candidatus Moranbacteria bacterium]|nr:type II secretion system protein [Candidatus Moranbacteria bacterium]
MKYNQNFWSCQVWHSHIKLKIKNPSSGFTLIEVMVVMAIIGVLAATAVVNIGQNVDRDVRQERDKLTTFLREVQSKALAGDVSGISFSGKICGFGVTDAGVSGSDNVVSYFVSMSNLDADCSDGSISKAYSSSSQKIDQFYLDNGVQINGEFDDLFFLIPDGAVYSGGSELSGTKTIELEKDGKTAAVSINESGNILEL